MKNKKEDKTFSSKINKMQIVAVSIKVSRIIYLFEELGAFRKTAEKYMGANDN